MATAIEDIIAAGKTVEETVNSGETTVTTEPAPAPAETVTATTETPLKTVETPSTERTPRDLQTGKFVPKNPAPVVAAQPQTQPDPDSDPKNWTYAAYRDEKQKRSEYQRKAENAEREASELRRQFAEFQRQQAPATPAHELMFSDAEEYQRQQDQRIEQFQRSTNLRASRAEAIAMYGIETVNATDAALEEAMKAGDPDIPLLRQRLMNSDDPVGIAIKWHKESRLKKEVGDDFDGFLAKKEAEIEAKVLAKYGIAPGEQQQPTPAAQTVQPSVMPTPLVSARSVGNRAPPGWQGPKPLADIFKRP